MGTGKITKAILGGIATIATLGCVATPELVGAAEAGPAEDQQQEKKDSVFVEETAVSQGDSQTFYHLAVFSSENSPYAKVLFTDAEDLDTLTFGARGNFDFGVLRGNAELIGFIDSDENHGIGLNARGEILGTRLGLALEKMVNAGSESGLSSFYMSRDFGDLNATLGIADIDDETSGIATFSYTAGKNMFGLGITADDEGGYLTAMAGRFAGEGGEDFGYRAWVKHDFDGNYVIDLLVSTNTTISKGAIGALTAADNGFHDQQLFPNKFDAFAYLHDRTSPGGVAANVNFSEIEDATNLVVDVLYQFQQMGHFSPRVGIKYTHADDGTDATESITGSIGTEFKNGYVDFGITGTEGGSPVFNLILGVSF